MIDIKNEFTISVKNGNDEKADMLINHIKKKYYLDLVEESNKSDKITSRKYQYYPKDDNQFGRKRKLSPQTEAEIKAKHFENGYTIMDLARLFDVSRSTVIRVLKR